jgi:predicted ester cyclase
VSEGWQRFSWTKMAAFFREEKAAVVRRFAEDVQCGRNPEIADELVTPDCVIHLPGMLLPVGPAGPKAVARTFLSAFSEMKITAEDAIVEGDRVAERLCLRAVHSGEFNGIPATGRTVSRTMNQIFRIEDGKIAEAWPEMGSAELMAQITAPEAQAA